MTSGAEAFVASFGAVRLFFVGFEMERELGVELSEREAALGFFDTCA